MINRIFFEFLFYHHVVVQ